MEELAKVRGSVQTQHHNHWPTLCLRSLWAQKSCLQRCTFFTEIGRTKMGWKVSTERSTSAQSQDALSSRRTLPEMVRVHLKVRRSWGF